ncbi:SDR family NAD(P)-dependent oxidoreductase [Yinghuangia aomiensis]
MPTTAPTAVVTGGTGGLARAVARALGTRPGAVVYLTGTDPVRGAEAARDLRAAGRPVRWEPLDVRDPAQARHLAAELAARHGGIDILVAVPGAQIGFDAPIAAQVRDYVEANNHGLARVLAAFLPVLRDGGRAVAVTGAFGSLEHLPLRLRDRFAGAGAAEVDAVMDAYVAAVEAGTAVAEGWPAWIEVASHVGQVAAVRAAAWGQDVGGERRDVLVNAVDPDVPDVAGLSSSAADTAWGQAAERILRAALPPAGAGEPHGELIRGGTVVPFAGERQQPCTR